MCIYNIVHNKTHIHTGGIIMSNSNKSGYEIRADLLSLAEGILTGNIHRDNDAVHVHNDNFPNDKRILGDQFVSVEEVIATARVLNDFVNEK